MPSIYLALCPFRPGLFALLVLASRAPYVQISELVIRVAELSELSFDFACGGFLYQNFKVFMWLDSY